MIAKQLSVHAAGILPMASVRGDRCLLLIAVSARELGPGLRHGQPDLE